MIKHLMSSSLSGNHQGCAAGFISLHIPTGNSSRAGSHGARQIRIYEVDHTATQAWKRQRLAEAQIELPPWLIFVPVDFERDDLGEKLVAAGFQQSCPHFSHGSGLCHI